ncbi:MAG: hypothetical protein O9295_16750 [Microcystis sp. LE18-22.4A]|uniref:hypothetical protein n=1 Tax=Microcystis sp. LE18-22.4A TaxID=3016432 RepID=UPI0022BF7875|nr:hypothetical protein [Microcystis sp. LE18-22.4A]MCZ8119648.1 hypothetical protein [Microcystis sp. LE18-22.4A]
MLPPEVRIILEDIFSDIQAHNRLSEENIIQLIEIDPFFLHKFAATYDITKEEVKTRSAKGWIDASTVFKYLEVRRREWLFLWNADH